MAWLFWAVTHDLWQSLPNTFHRTAGNLYDWVAWQNGVLTGGWLKNTFKTATSILWALNFVPTIAGLGVAWLANGIYNKASGKWWFFEWLAAPTKRAANWAKEWITWTMWNTWKLVSGTGKAIAGTLTAPLDVAFWRTRTSTWLQPDYNKSTTYSDYITTQAPNWSNTPSSPEQPKKQDTPIPLPIPTPSPSTPPSNSDKPKTQKEIDAETKKEEEKQKKEEEKSKEQEKNDYINKIEEHQKTLSKKIDDIKKNINKTKASEKAKDAIAKVTKQITDTSIYKTNYMTNKSNPTYIPLFTALATPGTTMTHTDANYILLKSLFNNITNGIYTEFSNLDKSFFSQDILTSKVWNSKSNGRQVKSAIEYVAEQLENNENIDTDSITSIKALIWPTSTDDGLLGKLYSIVWKNLKDVKSSKITEKDIKDQEDNLKSALDDLKTESQKSIKSIASKSLFWWAKINNDNKEDAISNIAEKYEEVIKYSQEDSDMGQISFEKDVSKLSDPVKNLISTIKA